MRKIKYDAVAVKTTPVEPILRKHLIMLATAYCAATGFRMSSVAAYAQADPRLFDKLIKATQPRKKVAGSKGISVSLRVYDKVVAYLGSKWPKGLHFPTLDDAIKSLKQDANHHGKKGKGKRTQSEES